MTDIRKYRDRIYIIKDIILTLSEYGQLNQTALISFCGLNLKKHRFILDELEANQMIERIERVEGKRTITIYKPSIKGIQFCRAVLDPYEELFPRGGLRSHNENKLGLFVFI